MQHWNKEVLSPLILLNILIIGCGSNSNGGGSGSIPLVTPPVKAAAPAGLNGSLQGSYFHHFQKLFNFFSFPTARASSSFDLSNFKNRFFSGSGPTDIFNFLLPTIDNLINGVNSQLNNSPPCSTQNPVQYQITSFGKTVTMYAQCYSTYSPNYSGDPAFLQFGINKGVSYIYMADGVLWTAAIVTPISGSSGQYSVEAYLGLGVNNGLGQGCGAAWDTCSYGVMHLSADQSKKSFELAVAGIGIGYCGAQLKSDGQNIYVTGSVDTGQSCGDVASACLSAADASTSETCTTLQQTFSLSPLGKQASAMSSAAQTHLGINGSNVQWGSSSYPTSSPSVILNGTSSDSIHTMGPIVPTNGVGSITSLKSNTPHS